MKVQPLDERVLIKPIEQEEKAGSIVIPDTAKEKPMKGEIVEVGPGSLNDKGDRVKLEVKKGDIVIWKVFWYRF